VKVEDKPPVAELATQIANLKELVEAKIEMTREVMAAHDRRYAEVALEREKALKIKEEADKAALGLAREIQSYKDEKANNLRSQIEQERGSYASQNDLKAAMEKVDAQLKPIAAYMSGQMGSIEALGQSRSRSQWSIGLMVGVVFSVIGVIGMLINMMLRK